MTTLGKMLKAIREDENLSLQDVADRAGMSKAHVWELESGRASNPRIDTLYCLAIALDREPEKFAGYAFTDCAKKIKTKTTTINAVVRN